MRTIKIKQVKDERAVKSLIEKFASGSINPQISASIPRLIIYSHEPKCIKRIALKVEANTLLIVFNDTKKSSKQSISKMVKLISKQVPYGMRIEYSKKDHMVIISSFGGEQLYDTLKKFDSDSMGRYSITKSIIESLRDRNRYVKNIRAKITDAGDLKIYFDLKKYNHQAFMSVLKRMISTFPTNISHNNKTHSLILTYEKEKLDGVEFDVFHVPFLPDAYKTVLTSEYMDIFKPYVNCIHRFTRMKNAISIRSTVDAEYKDELLSKVSIVQNKYGGFRVFTYVNKGTTNEKVTFVFMIITDIQRGIDPQLMITETESCVNQMIAGSNYKLDTLLGDIKDISNRVGALIYEPKVTSEETVDQIEYIFTCEYKIQPTPFMGIDLIDLYNLASKYRVNEVSKLKGTIKTSEVIKK